VNPTVIAVLAVSILLTAILSGIFGMAGGMILMGIITWIMPVEAAMVMHGVTQTASNGFRAALLYRAIRWRVLAPYMVGSLLAIAGFLALAFVPPRGVVFIVLGLLPFLSVALPPRWALDITRPGAPVAAGFGVSVFNMVSGVSGPILDMFFVKSPLTRHEVVATKAMTQTAGHILKLLYFGVLVQAVSDAAQPVTLPWWIYAMAVVLAVIGTTLGKQVLDRLTDHQFRRWSQWIIMAIGLVFLVRGVDLLIGG
jgi:uncharacterized membrane protein YfcA